MDNTQIAGRAWGLVWHHKFLWVLGFLASVIRYINQALDQDGIGDSGVGGAGAAAGQSGPLTGGELAVVILILGNIVGLFLLLLVISVVANSALLYSVAELDSGKPAGLWSAVGAGVRFVPRMIAAGFLLYLPLLILVGMAIFAELQSVDSAGPPVFPMLCVTLLYLLVAQLILEFANRAIVLERLGVFASIRRGKDVFLKKFAPTVGLMILVGIYAIPIGLVVLVTQAVHRLAGIVLLAVAVAIMAAFQSATFSVAYREWTGARAEVLPDEAQLALA